MPWGPLREAELGMGLARLHRVPYVGELGFEVFVSSDMAAHVAEVLLEAGEEVGLKPCGMLAVNAARLEKGFRHMGHDVTSEDHVLGVGLGFAVALAKGGFASRDAVLRRRQEGLACRLQFRPTIPARSSTMPSGS